MWESVYTILKIKRQKLKGKALKMLTTGVFCFFLSCEKDVFNWGSHQEQTA